MVRVCQTCALLLLFASTSWAVTPTTTRLADSNSAAKSKAKPAKTPAMVDTKLEKVAISLVDEHLPALKKVLDQLKRDHPRQYNLAIRDLLKSARKLESAKNRDEELFEIEVELLKTQSNLKLLTAKLKVRDNDSDRDSLRKTAMRLHDAQLAKARYDVRYTNARLEKAQQQLSAAKKRLESIEAGRESRLEKSYTALLREAGRAPVEKAKSRKPKKPE